MAAAIAKPIQNHVITPDAPRTQDGVNPNAARYGWCPFKDISLVNSDGTFYYYVQPESSPYHRNLPKNQLIPFITFPVTTFVDDYSVSSTPKNPNPKRADISTKTALEAVTEILHAHSVWGYTILNSLEGLEQETASRIFAVVQPFSYPLGEIINQLAFDAMERIESRENLVFPMGEYEAGYIVDALRNDDERIIANKLVGEMLAGAETAIAFANEIFDRTEQSMTTRFAGGKGKTGGDPLDRYLAEELDRDLPRLIGKEKTGGGGMEAVGEVSKKVDFLVDREIARSQQEEIDKLRREIDEMRSAQTVKPLTAVAEIPEIDEKPKDTTKK